jgi:hypothetical protein
MRRNRTSRAGSCKKRSVASAHRPFSWGLGRERSAKFQNAAKNDVQNQTEWWDGSDCYRWPSPSIAIEWMEFRSLHGYAVASLQEGADSAMLTVQMTAYAACHQAALRAVPLAHPGMTNKIGASRVCETPASFGQRDHPSGNACFATAFQLMRRNLP